MKLWGERTRPLTQAEALASVTNVGAIITATRDGQHPLQGTTFLLAEISRHYRGGYLVSCDTRMATHTNRQEVLCPTWAQALGIAKGWLA